MFIHYLPKVPMIHKLEHLLAKEFDPGFEQRARFIFNAIEIHKPKKILDAGCGRGFYSHAASFFPFVQEVQGFDVNKSYIRIAKSHCTDKRIHIQKANIYKLPYPNDYFDMIIFSEVLEHLPHEEYALNELSRVLKKEGFIALTVPNVKFPFLWDPLNWTLMRIFHTHVPKDIWWLAGMWADHNRLYSFVQLKKLLIKSSFTVVQKKESVHWSWPFTHLMLYGIGKNIIERLGITAVSRFEFKPPSALLSFGARFIKFPSVFLDRRFPIPSSVNICVLIKKKI